MRSILKKPSCYRQFSTVKLNSVIQQKMQKLEQQSSSNYVKYEDIFFKLYTNHLQHQKKLQSQINRLNGICLVESFPCKAILEHFQKTSHSYSEQYVVQTFVRLAKAYRISQQDSSCSGDYSVSRLFYTPAFDNLIEEFKFGLRKQKCMSWQNMIVVGECLLEIGYVDYQVFSIILNAVEKRINKEERLDDEIRHPQLEKKDYYIAKYRTIHNQIVSNQQFQGAIKVLMEKVAANDLKQNQRQRFSDLKQSLEQQMKTSQEKAIETENLLHSINQTITMIETYNQNLDSLIEGIISVRKQYQKMAKISESQTILRNPEINLELLQLQEHLLVKKLININDIRNPDIILNQTAEIERVVQVLTQFVQSGIENNNGEQINMKQLSQFTYFNEQQNQQNLKNNNQSKSLSASSISLENKQLCKAMALLSKFAEANKRLYNSPDGRSLVNLKWERTLINSKHATEKDNQFRENLHPETIFHRTFKDLHEVFKRNYSIIMFTFIEVSLKDKIEFFQCLARMGLYEQIINLLKSSDLSKEKIQAYTISEFASLLRVFNDIGSKINAPALKKAITNRIIDMNRQFNIQVEYSKEQPIQNSIQFLMNAINYLIQEQYYSQQTPSSQEKTVLACVEMKQAQNQPTQIQTTYNKLVLALADKVKYLEESQNYLIEPYLQAAYRLLSRELPSTYRFIPAQFYARYGVDHTQQAQLKEFLFKRNPFFAILKEVAMKQAESTPLNDKLPFIQKGFNSKGETTGVLLCSSNESSIDGKYVNGHIQAEILRIKRDFHAEIIPFSVNTLIEIDYQQPTIAQGSTKQAEYFKFKNKQQISEIMSLMLNNQSEQQLTQFTNHIIKVCVIIKKHYKATESFLAVVRFLNTMNQILRVSKQDNKQVISAKLFQFRNYKLWILLDFLKQDYNMVPKHLQAQMEKLFKKQALPISPNPTSHSSSTTSSKGSSLLVQTISNIQQKLLNACAIEQKKTEKQAFEGKRYTIQTINDNEQKDLKQIIGNVGIQLLATATYTDKSVCLYSDWKNKIKKYYPLEKINLQNTSNITQILTKKYLPNVNQCINVLPMMKLSQMRKPTQFNDHSLEPQQNNNNDSWNAQQSIKQKQAEKIAELMKFIHEIKISKKPEEIVEYIFSFQFLNNLMTTPSNTHKAQVLHRDPERYFSYLELKNDKVFLESPNLQNLFKKLQKQEQIHSLFQQRKQSKVELKIQYQLGKISRKQYFVELDKVDTQIIAKMKQFENKLLDKTDNKILQHGLKMVSIEKDEKELERVLSRVRYYDRNFDKDVIYAKGNLVRALKIKRRRAEKNLLLFKYIHKLATAQNEVNILEKRQIDFLKKQIRFIEERLQNPSKQDCQDIYSENYTNLTVKNLSKNDQQKLQLSNSNLANFQDFSVSDIILQLQNLLDKKALQSFQKSIIARYYNRKHSIPLQIFLSSFNKQFSSLSHNNQKAIIQESSKLDNYEKQLLQQLIQTFKIESFSGKERFNKFYDTYAEDIQVFNQTSGRVEIISEYLNQKQFEYNQDYNPKLIVQIKQREVMKLWNIIFKKQYDSCDRKTISDVTTKICERLALLKANSQNQVSSSPPFFGAIVLKILSHPQTDILTKQNLIASLELNKIPLKIDSEDIRQLGYDIHDQEKKQFKSQQQLMDQLRAISNKDFIGNINKKLNMIL